MELHSTAKNMGLKLDCNCDIKVIDKEDEELSKWNFLTSKFAKCTTCDSRFKNPDLALADIIIHLFRHILDELINLSPKDNLDCNQCEKAGFPNK